MSTPNGAISTVPNCGPVALAASTGHDLDRIMDWMRAKYKKGHQWKGRTRMPQLLAFLKAHHIGWTPMASATGSLRTFVDQHTVQGRGVGYIIEVGGHFVTAIDGAVIDQVASAPASDHWASNKRVKRAYRINL